MAAKTVENQLAALSAIRSDPTAGGAVALLRVAVGSRVNLVVAKAAAIVQASEQSAFLPELAAALTRFYAPGSDRGCDAKAAITECLYTLGHGDAEAFLPGVRHVQMEGSYGPPVDAAIDLRGWSALGLARAGYRDVLLVLGELLADAAAACRQMAVRAMAYAGADGAAPLLRYKVLAGDPEPAVTAECFAALMKLTPRASLPFVGRFLGGDPERAEAAATAIGETRTEAAWQALKAAWDAAIDPEVRRGLLPGIGLTRQAAAVAFLLERVERDRPAPAAEAVAAMAIYRHDPAVGRRLTDAADRNGDAAVRAAVAQVLRPAGHA